MKKKINGRKVLDSKLVNRHLFLETAKFVLSVVLSLFGITLVLIKIFFDIIIDVKIIMAIFGAGGLIAASIKIKSLKEILFQN